MWIVTDGNTDRDTDEVTDGDTDDDAGDDHVRSSPIRSETVGIDGFQWNQCKSININEQVMDNDGK